MIDRKEKRKAQRALKAIEEKAKKDMMDWMLSLDRHPSPDEINAWKNGYISGINRSKDN